MPTARPRLAFFLPSLEGGGAQRVIVNLLAGFDERGVPIDLILARAEGEYLAQVPPAVRVIDLGVPRMLRALPPLAAHLARERPETVLSGLDHANVVAMAASRVTGRRTRTVISVHCHIARTLAGAGFRDRAVPWLLGRAHRWADRIVAVSSGVADDLVATAGIPRERIDVIYNPVITHALFDLAAHPPAHPWFTGHGGPLVLGIGRLTAQKNFPMLIDAFARLKRTHPQARLAILGEGPDRPLLEAQLRRLGLDGSIVLPGFQENPYAWLARATVFALSSDFEGLPTVLIESLALGTAVVSTDCDSGPREILRDGLFGELVPTGDARAMARAMASAIARPRPLPPAEALEPFTLAAVVDRFQTVLGVHA
jgi:glycosyltransferase involved in cell wall biosynthesis